MVYPGWLGRYIPGWVYLSHIPGWYIPGCTTTIPGIPLGVLLGVLPPSRVYHWGYTSHTSGYHRVYTSHTSGYHRVYLSVCCTSGCTSLHAVPQGVPQPVYTSGCVPQPVYTSGCVPPLCTSRVCTPLCTSQGVYFRLWENKRVFTSVLGRIGGSFCPFCQECAHLSTLFDKKVTPLLAGFNGVLSVRLTRSGV